ncbi:MAG: hypothetical protein AAGA66_11720 [Bacteroidota bacterium]
MRRKTSNRTNHLVSLLMKLRTLRILRPMNPVIVFVGLVLGVVCCTHISDDSEQTYYPGIAKGEFYACRSHESHFHQNAEVGMDGMHTVLGDSSLPNVDKKFLFVIHVTTDSLGQTIFDRGLVTEAAIKDAVRGAGDFFSRIGIEFEAEDSVYVIKNPRYDKMGTTEELGENATLNAKRNRINLFLIEAFEEELAFAAGIAAGNYMYIVPDGANAGTIAHEAGHLFSLQHTFGTGDVIAAGAGEPFDSTDELVDGSNCATAGDFVCDTPADPYIYPEGDADPVTYFQNCIFVYDSVDANGHYYDPLPGNIMSYYTAADCPCSSFLTDGQLRKVADAYYSSPERYSWW